MYRVLKDFAGLTTGTELENEVVPKEFAKGLIKDGYIEKIDVINTQLTADASKEVDTSETQVETVVSGNETETKEEPKAEPVARLLKKK